MITVLPPSIVMDRTQPAEFTIVGVIADTRNGGLRSNTLPTLLVPYTIAAPTSRPLAVRTAGDPNLLRNPVRAEVRAMDAEQPLGRPTTFGALQEEEFTQPRFTM